MLQMPLGWEMLGCSRPRARTVVHRSFYESPYVPNPYTHSVISPRGSKCYHTRYSGGVCALIWVIPLEQPLRQRNARNPWRGIAASHCIFASSCPCSTGAAWCKYRIVRQHWFRQRSPVLTLAMTIFLSKSGLQGLKATVGWMDQPWCLKMSLRIFGSYNLIQTNTMIYLVIVFDYWLFDQSTLFLHGIYHSAWLMSVSIYIYMILWFSFW